MRAEPGRPWQNGMPWHCGRNLSTLGSLHASNLQPTAATELEDPFNHKSLGKDRRPLVHLLRYCSRMVNEDGGECDGHRRVEVRDLLSLFLAYCRSQPRPNLHQFGSEAYR